MEKTMLQAVQVLRLEAEAHGMIASDGTVRLRACGGELVATIYATEKGIKIVSSHLRKDGVHLAGAELVLDLLRGDE
jgi:hypothetical protein